MVYRPHSKTMEPATLRADCRGAAMLDSEQGPGFAYRGPERRRGENRAYQWSDGQQESFEALRKTHALLLGVLEGTNDAVFAKDLQGRYLLVNSAAAQMLG